MADSNELAKKTEQAKAEKALLDAEKATLEARKALADTKKAADLSAAQSAFGTVAGSGIEGTTALKPDAGKGEATLLAARAIATAAERIATALKDKVSGKRLILQQGWEVPQFANYRQFLLQKGLLRKAFADTKAEAQRLLDQADKLLKPAVQGEALMAAPALTTAGVAIDAIAKLGSYFMANYEAGGIALTPDGEQLVSAVAEQLLAQSAINGLVLPGRRVPQPGDFAATIDDLATATSDAQATASNLEAKAREATAKNPQAAKLYEQAATLLRTAIAKGQEFVTVLAATDAKGVVLMTKIVQEQIVCDALAKENTLALVLDVRAAVGGYYTKKSLWTFFGSMPFFAMGGAVVTYGLVDKEGELKASGLVPVHSGYAPVNEIARLIAGD